MKPKKLFAAVLCIALCMAMLPAYAETLETVYFDLEGISIDLPKEWIIGKYEDGLNSELAQEFGLTQSDIDSLYSGGAALRLIACPDSTADTQFQAIIIAGMSGDMHTLSDSDRQVIEQSAHNSAASYNAEVVFVEVFFNGEVYFGKTLFDCGDRYILQYTTFVDNTGYLFQLCDYTGAPINDATISFIDELICTVDFDSDAPAAAAVNFEAAAPSPVVENGMIAYELPDIGVTVCLPEAWIAGRYVDGEHSDLALSFGLNAETTASLFGSADAHSSIIAVVDMTTNEFFTIDREAGIPGIDMRDDARDWDAAVESFLSGFSVAEVVDCCRFETPVVNFIKTYGVTDGHYFVQYSTSFDNYSYYVQFLDFSGQPISAETIDTLDTIVYNIVFE